MVTGYKVCPQCRNAATFDAAFCSCCGHRYRTPSPGNRTQFITPAGPPVPVYYRPYRNRLVGALWAFLLGGLGAHKFYLGEHGWGVAYLLFCWTFLPALVSIIDAVVLLMMSDFTFDTLYNREWIV